MYGSNIGSNGCMMVPRRVKIVCCRVVVSGKMSANVLIAAINGEENLVVSGNGEVSANYNSR